MGSTTELDVLVEEYKLLSASLDRHQNFIYGVLPGLGALVAGGLAFATKEVDPANQIYLWVAAPWVVALAVLWTAISQSVFSLIALHLVALEQQINRGLSLEPGSVPVFSSITSFQARRGLAFHTSSCGSGLGAAPNLRLLMWLATTVLIGFVVVCLVVVVKKGSLLWIANATAVAVCLVSSACSIATSFRVRRSRDALVFPDGQASSLRVATSGTSVVPTT